MNQWIVTGGSAAVIIFMVTMAALLGFRQTAKLDDATLARLAAGEGAAVDQVVVAPNGRSAFARLANGKLMIARVMADGVSARAAQPGAVTLRLRNGKLSAAFGDVGYPPLHMKLESTPGWLAELAGEHP